MPRFARSLLWAALLVGAALLSSGWFVQRWASQAFSDTLPAPAAQLPAELAPFLRAAYRDDLGVALVRCVQDEQLAAAKDTSMAIWHLRGAALLTWDRFTGSDAQRIAHLATCTSFGIWGRGYADAAHAIFGRTLEQLRPAELAQLVVLSQAPQRWMSMPARWQSQSELLMQRAGVAP